MTISNETARAVADVLHKNLVKSQIDAIIKDLKEVKGNASFRASIQLIIDELIVWNWKKK